MFWTLAICLVFIIIACVFGLPEKWLETEQVKIFKAPTGAPYMADMYFDDFVNVNKKYGIKITVVKVERIEHLLSFPETWYYYKEEKLKATNEN